MSKSFGHDQDTYSVNRVFDAAGWDGLRPVALQAQVRGAPRIQEASVTSSRRHAAVHPLLELGDLIGRPGPIAGHRTVVQGRADA